MSTRPIRDVLRFEVDLTRTTTRPTPPARTPDVQREEAVPPRARRAVATLDPPADPSSGSIPPGTPTSTSAPTSGPATPTAIGTEAPQGEVSPASAGARATATGSDPTVPPSAKRSKRSAEPQE